MSVFPVPLVSSPPSLPSPAAGRRCPLYEFSQSCAARLNCSQPDPSDQLACLNTKNATELVAATLASTGIPFLDFLEPPSDNFKPCIDGTFIPLFPLEGIVRGKFNRVTYLGGSNLNDGNLSVANSTVTDFIESITPPQFVRKIQSQYTVANTAPLLIPGEDPNFGIILAIYTDAFFLFTNFRTHKALRAAGAPSYAYRYSQITADPKCEQGDNRFMGATHGFEIPFVFGSAATRGCTFTPEEQEMSLAREQSYTSLANDGVPTTGGEAWPRFPELVEFKIPFSLDPVKLESEFDSNQSSAMAFDRGGWEAEKSDDDQPTNRMMEADTLPRVPDWVKWGKIRGKRN
ncbi:Alpha/Beta hydrolase protein [Blyttiomyces helicus]|uniref:Alpha/Beta hydrolase protein n=1 Tax=Blyttiomyces helicus TaxID=388810 RepID=A0A4P9WMH1_9FUNG|nr:Alpha/Beta hydrolase protein [Blyttiomyces helicus]|eukprot:RKO93415.1 Alpha/Beta hydrolase protein [Blyttiomyces helicus]